MLSFALLWGVSPPFKSPVETPKPMEKIPMAPSPIPGDVRVESPWHMQQKSAFPRLRNLVLVHGRTLRIHRELHGNSIAWWRT